MKRFLKIVALFLIWHQYLCAQNLVPNSSFEEFKKCPEKEGQFNKNVIKWKSANKASPDFFNSCSTNKITNTVSNCDGTQSPHQGNAYGGIVVYHEIQNFREYIQCKLTEPLKAKQIYCCSFYVNLADKSGKYTDKIGMFLSKKRIRARNKLVIEKNPQIRNKNGLYLDNKKVWTLICDTFQARGGEQYVTIGNFFNDNNTSIKIVDDIKALKKKYPSSYYNDAVDNAYYYIDDVSVIEIFNARECNCIQKKKDSVLVVNQTKPQLDTIAPQLGESIILKDLVFETNKSEILPTSYNELNKVADYLNKKLEYKIELAGHTDNIGKEEDNQKLSEARAKAIADYLLSRGISKERISYKGYGSIKPLTTNDTEEGRLQNRRVEFIIK